MTRPALRVAVRRFGPFETAIRKQFEAFCAETGENAAIEPVAMDLEGLTRAMFDDNGLRNGDWDIGFVVTDWLPMAVEDGHLVDLTARSGEDAPDLWPECLRGQQRIGGGLWGLPYHDGPQCLIYRPDLFAGAADRFAERHGRALAVPESWDDFVEIAKFFTDPGAGRWGAVVASYPDAHNTVYDFCAQIWSRGGVLTDAKGRPDLASREAQQGLDFYRWLVRESGAVHPAALQTDSVKSGALFANGEAAMMTNWFGFAAHAVGAEDSPVRGRVGVAPMPHAPESESAAVLVYWVLGVGSGSRHADLAARFIRYATSAPMDRLLTLEGGIGCRTTTWTDPAVTRMIPFAGEMGRLHGLARMMPADRRLPELAAIIDTAVAESLRSEDPTERILGRAQDKVDTLWNRR